MKKKRILSIACILSLFLMAGCAGNEAGESSQQGNKAATSAENAAEPAGESAGEAAGESQARIRLMLQQVQIHLTLQAQILRSYSSLPIFLPKDLLRFMIRSAGRRQAMLLSRSLPVNRRRAIIFVRN